MYGSGGGSLQKHRLTATRWLQTLLPACGNFEIRVRHNGLGGHAGFVLPVKARVGRTFEALGHFIELLINLDTRQTTLRKRRL